MIYGWFTVDWLRTRCVVDWLRFAAHRARFWLDLLVIVPVCYGCLRLRAFALIVYTRLRLPHVYVDFVVAFARYGFVYSYTAHGYGTFTVTHTFTFVVCVCTFLVTLRYRRCVVVYTRWLFTLRVCVRLVWFAFVCRIPPTVVGYVAFWLVTHYVGYCSCCCCVDYVTLIRTFVVTHLRYVDVVDYI